MSATTPAATAPTATPTLPTRFYGIAAMIAPILLLFGTVAFLTRDEGINNGIMGGTISAWAAYALILAFVGIGRFLEPVAPRGAVVVTVLSVAWASGLAFAVQAIDEEHFGESYFNADPLPSGADALGFLTVFPFGLLGPVLIVITGVLLWRTGLVARWAAGAIVLGGVIFPLGRAAQIDALAPVSDVLLVIGLAPTGLAMIAAARKRP